MNEEESMKIYEYFNDIGIVDYDNINLFLNIYSNVSKKKGYNNKEHFLKIALFSYMKTISKDENKLYEFANRVINSFKNNQIISKYKSMKIIKTILYFKLRNILSKLLLKITRKKNIKVINSKNSNIDLRPNKSKNNKNIYFKTIQKEEEECTFTPRINKNFQPYYEKKPINTKIKYNSPIFDITSKISKKYSQYKKTKKALMSNNSNSCKNIHNIISYNNNENKNKFFSIDNDDNCHNFDFKENYNFYKNEQEHLERVNEKILKMKMKKNINLEKNCTFKPEINKNYKLKKVNSESTIYINNISKNKKMIIKN